MMCSNLEKLQVFPSNPSLNLAPTMTLVMNHAVIRQLLTTPYHISHSYLHITLLPCA